VEKGALFTSISGNWTVPSARQHTAHRAESSSAWIGIGGGCPEPKCVAPSATLIQEGTERDVGKRGKAHYSAWWELIPAPSVTISGFAVHPGDCIHASIAESVPGSNVWAMSMKNLTTGKSWSQTVPYTSTHDTAEWILETPLTFGTGGAGLAEMPNLSTVRFDRAMVNGARAGLAGRQEMQLVNSKNRPVATPSAPDAQRDGFNVCTYRSRCPTP
jgi:Peptidase A4 family